MFTSIKKIHFVGIGGAGMSAIARVMLELGYEITGSDISKSSVSAKLEQLGAKIYYGHDASNIEQAEAIVTSTAIRETNPEIQAAHAKNIPVFHRSEAVAFLMDQRQGIAVAGAHGKTTTTSMIALMLEKAGVDPTIIIGGELEYIGGNAKLGKGPYLVAEADESDGSFLNLSPKIAVVTNIENDHMDYYGTMENILQTFHKFLLRLPADNGFAVLCFDNAYIRDMADSLGRTFMSYAIDHPADLMARNIRTEGAVTHYDLYQCEEYIGSITLNVPGKHNIRNSLAAVAVGLKIGLDFSAIAAGLVEFRGAKRRFQTKARINGVWIVDDYAHHPTEITTTLLAARQTEPKRLICVFQPHRFSRTKLLRSEYGMAFKPADVLILTDIYAAGEDAIDGINGEVIKEEVEQKAKQQVTYIADLAKIARYLAEIVEPGDLVITMGAGNIYKAGEELVERLVK
ncbi:UDP-N-acetylmuramate--alanine ligase [Sporomusaceae bacterium BoRhaA]|uniref:UDP-N-acetylmuramate--L-alanine ligase n=1 Tax=Pelorhabdus rhamnosifermentans TaxID=2772457 RepID=UPI001C0603C6|nr:UDP-N-acetylmuramate--L-alanine ligase [Pelorhabdus rhamnosifermentans]MBU2702987.1 UDP-N-acetylmuramate--alanine ligase [Pelorhabdus rhamnosifermentans]